MGNKLVKSLLRELKLSMTKSVWRSLESCLFRESKRLGVASGSSIREANPKGLYFTLTERPNPFKQGVSLAKRLIPLPREGRLPRRGREGEFYRRMKSAYWAIAKPF